MNLRKLACTLLIIPTLGLLVEPVAAQETSLCFMRNAEGRIIDLGALCGVKPTSQISEINSQSQKIEISEERMGGLAYIYAEKYCEWRQIGKTHEDSNKRALNELTDMIIKVYGIDGAKQVIDRFDVNFINKRDKFIKRNCPNYK